METNLSKLRLEKGIKQEEVAAVLGVTRQAFSRYERGERELGYEGLVALAKFFDVSVDYLLGNSTYYYPDKVGVYPSQISEEEQSFLDLFRRLSRGERVQLLSFAAGLIGKERPNKKFGD